MTIVLQKPGSSKDYIVPKSYYLIALLNILKKILEVVVVKRILYTLEKNRLLPRGYFRGYKRVLTDYIVYIIIEIIRTA